MKILGLITEYNPFHNGHLYHLNESKKITGCDYTVCVMSGNFIQRGEPALLDKWTRAEMAIKGGVDLVLELPAVYSVSTAELFAFGSIKTLDSLGVVDSVCFGSEAGDVDSLDKISKVLINEPDEYKYQLRLHLDNGLPFFEARANALKQILNIGNIDNILNSSNNILGIEYLKGLNKIHSRMNPFTIKRIKNEYNSIDIIDEICSATSIRQKLLETGDIDSIKFNVPPSTYEILKESMNSGNRPVFYKDFDKIILTLIKRATLDELRDIFDVNEGLEYRIKEAGSKAASIEELIKLIKSKRYTQTRIQRILIHLLLNIKKYIYEELKENCGPQYLRVLGFNQKGQEILHKAKKIATLPIITKVAKFKNSENELLKSMLEADVNAMSIYSSLHCHINDYLRDIRILN